MITMGNLSGFRRTLGRCIGKKIYPSEKHAWFTINTLTRNNAHCPELGRLEPYRCDKGHIHIGHTRKQGR